MLEALSNRASIPSRFVANYSSTPLDPPMNSFSCSERLRNISYFSEKNVETCVAAKIVPLIAVKRAEHSP